MSNTLQELIERWRTERLLGDPAKGIDPVAAATAKSQYTWARNFTTWVAASTDSDPDSLSLAVWTEARLKEYIKAMQERGLRPRTIRAAILAHRAFGCWLVDRRLTRHNHAARLLLPKKDASRRRTCTNAEAFGLLAACERISHDGRRCACAKAALSILIYGGLRRGELLDLKVVHVDMKESCVYVDHGKGDKARTVYLPPEAIKDLDDWFLHRGKCAHDHLLDQHRRVPLGTRGLDTILDDARRVAGMQDARWLTPHVLRHNYATRLVENGANLIQVQEALGHSSPEITTIYLHNSPEKRRETATFATFAQQKQEEQKAPPTPAQERPKERRRETIERMRLAPQSRGRTASPAQASKPVPAPRAEPPLPTPPSARLASLSCESNTGPARQVQGFSRPAPRAQAQGFSTRRAR